VSGMAECVRVNAGLLRMVGVCDQRASFPHCIPKRSQSEVKFIWSRIKKRREPRVTVVTLKLCGDKKSLYSLYEKYPTCAA
jgi:hypothetical protein